MGDGIQQEIQHGFFFEKGVKGANEDGKSISQ